MKVRKFEVLTDAVRLTPYRGNALEVSFDRMQPRPTRRNPIEWIGWDKDIGRHGPAYRLADGSEGAVLWDQALSVADDPAYVARMQEHAMKARLVEALDNATEGTSVRELARKLNTSISQVQRLQGPSATLDGLVHALIVLGHDVHVQVNGPRKRSEREEARRKAS